MVVVALCLHYERIQSHGTPETRSLGSSAGETWLSLSRNRDDLSSSTLLPFVRTKGERVGGFLKFPDKAGSRGIEAADRTFGVLFFYSSGVCSEIVAVD